MKIRLVAILVTLCSLIGYGSAHDEPFFDDGGVPVSAEAPLDTGSTGAAGLSVISDGPMLEDALRLVGRGERKLSGATTDVWVHKGYAYLGTFNEPCGDGTTAQAGVRIYDVRDPYAPTEVGALPSVSGSRVNDIKVAGLNSGTVLVHSNERCQDGPGGFELYDLSDPLKPVHLAHVQTDSINKTLRQRPDHRDEGVHNLFLFSQEGRDYVAAQVYTVVGSFQVFDITDPSQVRRVSTFGAERVRWPEVDWELEDDAALLEEAETYLRSGYGQSTNRFLHDHYITPDAQTVYLANWDAGLIRLDISDVHNPKLVAVALDPNLEDGEVNSHSVWTSEDGKTVVEGEEDFTPFVTQFRIEGEDKVYPSAEGSVTREVSSLGNRTLSGRVLFLGNGCEALPAASSDATIALVKRGECTFRAKAALAKTAGYAGLVVFNHAEGGEELVFMGGEGKVGLPGLFVGHGTGLELMNATSETELRLGTWGETISATVEADGWSGLRIWDYSDPAKPVLASTFNTLCSAHPDDPSCQKGSIYSSHNLIIEDGLAYVSWYSEGLLVIDISDPYNPVELARYKRTDDEFISANGGPQDVWGSYKVPGEPWLYASDRNGGLYIFALSAEAKHAVRDNNE